MIRLQPPQQKNTGFSVPSASLSITLVGGPMEPSGLVSHLAQNLCDSAALRSSGLSLARLPWTFKPSTRAAVLASSLRASFSQPLQQRNTACSSPSLFLIVILSGTPMDP